MNYERKFLEVGRGMTIDFPNGDMAYAVEHGPVVYWEYSDGGGWVLDSGILLSTNLGTAETILLAMGEGFDAYNPNCWDA